MRTRLARTLVLAAAVLAAGGCATAEEWREWRSHSTHFASGQHMAFSVRNREGTKPHVRRSDVDAARAQNWWGKVITVSPDQIFQN